MGQNNADIQLLASLDITSSEQEILRAIKILENRIKNKKMKVEIEADVDTKTISSTLNKLQSILKEKDLTIDTKNSIEAISKEAMAMLEVVDAAKKASKEKLEFTSANKKVKSSAEDTASAINQERSAMDSLDDINTIMNNLTSSGQQGDSVFQQFGTTLRDAFSTYTVANLLTDAIQEAVIAGKEGVQVVKELNDESTSLRMATGDSKEEVNDLMNAYNEMGQELGSITSDVSESADEWLRQGHSINDTNTLIKDSMILSKVSNLESADSTKYLTSAMQGYKVEVEDVIGVVDKLSAVDLESATDAGGLAEAMSRTAESANIAEISIDRLLGMIATVGEVTQKDMSSIGESFKTIFSRMRNIKDGKLSMVGDDEEIEDLSNVEVVLNSLGIKLRESNQEFRNFQDVLDEVAENWGNYSSVQQAAVAKSFAGVRQQENFLVLMENWDKVKKYTDVATNSAGTAEEKFGYYLESLEAKTNSLTASLENLASTTISEELYAFVLDTTKGIVDLTAETGVLKGALTGLGAAGSIYMMQQLAQYLKGATQGFANLSEAMNMTKSGAVGLNDMQRLVDLAKGLSDSQVRLMLNTNNLTDAQKVAILMNRGLSQAEAEQQIQTWGVATAQNGATAATVTFSGAIKGLWATLLANPLVLVATLVTTGAMAFNKVKEAQEEAKQKSRELTQAWKEENETINESILKYEELNSAIESGTLTTDEITSAKEELVGIEDTLSEKYGTEALNIDLVNGKYEEQLATLKELSKEKAKQYIAENGKAIESDIDYLEEDVHRKSGVFTYGSVDSDVNSALGFNLSEILEKYANIGTIYSKSSLQKGYKLYTSGTREETYNQLVDLYDELKTKYGSNNEKVKSVLDQITELLNSDYDKDEIDSAKERVKAYAEADILSQNDTRTLYDKSVNAVDKYNEALEEGTGVDEARANLEAVQEEVEKAFGTSGILASVYGAETVFEDVWAAISSGAAKAAGNITKEFTRSDMISNLNSLSEGFEELDKIYSSIADDDPFDFKLLDDEKFKENFSGLGDVYADFVEQITSNSDDIGACQDAFDNLVTAWVNSTGVLNNVTEENKALTVSMLEQMGVSNASEVVASALENQALATRACELAGIDLSTATAEEINALNNLDSELINSGQQVFDYYLNKKLTSETTIDTSADCNNLIALANQCHATGENLALLIKLKNCYMTMESSIWGEASKELAAKEAEKIKAQLSSTSTTSSVAPKYSYKAPSSSKSSSSNSSSSKETKEDLDWIETKLSRIQRNITNLGKTVSATYKQWSTRNKALTSEMAKVNEEITIQQQAYNKYMALANSVSLSSKYKKLVQNGAISVETITDETLADKIKEYKEFYEKALECSDAILDLKDNLADLAKQHFDNVVSEYDNQLSQIAHKINMIQGEIDQIETSGYLARAKHYEELIAQESQNITLMQKNYDALIKARTEAMKTGQIEEFSDDWYDMTAEILDLEEALQDANTALIEYNNSLRELKWDAFDRMVDALSSVNSEAEFLREVLSYKDMFNDDGTYTEFGKATQGLNAVEMNSLYSQAEEYKKELEEINKLLAEDPYNVTLDERRNELQDAYYDKLTEALQKEQEMMDTEQERYDALLSYLDEAINKEKDRLSTIKDQYDFEKDISEQTKNIADLEKILNAIEGDDSESNRLFKQQTTNDLADARENLEETMYEKYVSDREKLLDNLYDEAESFISLRMDERDQVLTDLIADTNENAESIGDTLKETASSVGADLSSNMDSIWGTNGEFTSVVTKYSDNFTNLLTTTNNVLSSIRDKINAMTGGSTKNDSTGSTATTKPSTSTGATSSSSSSTSSTSTSSSGKWGSWFVTKKNSYNKSKLKKDVSIVDRLKYNDFDSNFSARSSYYKSMGGSGTYTGSSSQNQWMIAQMKKNGFRQGGTIGKLIKSTGEDGFVLARTGEEILSQEKVEQLVEALKLTKPVFDYSAIAKRQMDSLNKLSNISNNVGGTQNYSLQFDGDIVMEGVQDPKAFAEELNNQLRTNKVTQKIIQSDTIGVMLGKNSLTKHSIR